MNPGDQDVAGAALVYRRKSAELDRRIAICDAWRDEAPRLAGLAVAVLMEGADDVVRLLAEPLAWGVSQEPDLRRLHGVVSCAALVLGEPEPPPLPSPHADDVLDVVLAELIAQLRAAVLAHARDTSIRDH